MRELYRHHMVCLKSKFECVKSEKRNMYVFVLSEEEKYEADFQYHTKRDATMCDIRQSSARQEICDILCRSRFL